MKSTLIGNAPGRRVADHGVVTAQAIEREGGNRMQVDHRPAIERIDGAENRIDEQDDRVIAIGSVDHGRIGDVDEVNILEVREIDILEIRGSDRRSEREHLISLSVIDQVVSLEAWKDRLRQAKSRCRR